MEDDDTILTSSPSSSSSSSSQWKYDVFLNFNGAFKKLLLNMKIDIIKARLKGGDMLYLKQLISVDGI
ncbi:hypothetical protein QQP08_020051 [Theobroma cacao]|nr:hypothetical protein QQP08_020051 [Theobroma cacao]